MTKFMHNDVVHKMLREKHNLVVEVQIAMLRATPPAAALIFDRNTLVHKSIVLIKKQKSFGDDVTCKFFVFEVVLNFPATTF